MSPFVPDTTLRRFDRVPPPTPHIQSFTLQRGHPGYGSEGQIDLVLDNPADYSFFEFGYRVVLVGGRCPNGLTIPPGYWSPLHWAATSYDDGLKPRDPASFEVGAIELRWNDGATWDQDPFNLTLKVVAVDYAGNESAPSNTVVVRDSGDLRSIAKQSLKNEAYNAMREAFSGRWVGTDKAGGAELVTRDDSFGLSEGGKRIVGSMDARPTDTPNRFTLVMVSDHGTTTWPGICEFDGDTLRICVAQGRAPRPTAFTSSSDGATRLFTLRRSPIVDK